MMEEEEESARARTRAVRLVCWRCARRYAFVVDPHCGLCEGTGLVGAPIPSGVNPPVAARAASIQLEQFCWNEVLAMAVKERRQTGRLAPCAPDDRGLEQEVPTTARHNVGRDACALLKNKRLPPRAWSKLVPGEREQVLQGFVEILQGLP